MQKHPYPTSNPDPDLEESNASQEENSSSHEDSDGRDEERELQTSHTTTTTCDEEVFDTKKTKPCSVLYGVLITYAACVSVAFAASFMSSK